MDLSSVISGTQSAAVAYCLIQQLGEGSAIAAEMAGGPEHRPWTTQTVIAAGMFNALTSANWQRAGGKGKKPKPVAPPKRKPKVAGRAAADAVPNARARRFARAVALRGALADSPPAIHGAPPPDE